MNQKLSDWASIAEVVSATAIVLSLVYVGYQVRENTIEVRATDRQQLVARSMSATSNWADPAIADVISKALVGEPLSRVEFAQYGYVVRTLLYDVQEAFLLYNEGRLEEAYWNTRASIAMAYFESAIARDIYRRDAELGALQPDFVRWLDGAITERYGD